ncbi:hypothetical protein ANN_10665 [Periplaneta americana]|uniref:Mutator-like transposase domain-containing protein n=2 Tax=Periplaneta americana TaxID=6978 RepID=A0ABQ8T2Y2_PERAM|nr:hypothetical protein ANN_10665 [Periplaneta americana]
MEGLCEGSNEPAGSSKGICNTESTRPPFDVNRRMVNAFVTMGKGHSAMEQHCMAMGMAGLSSPSFNSHLIKLTEENKLVRQHVLRNAHSAVRRAHMEVDSSISDSDVINIGVSYDGTWMWTYIKWYQSHKDAGVCEKNFDGSSNAMEMKAAEILWTRSIRLCNMRYTTLLSDGDAKTHHHLQQLQVYGEGIDIRKEECVNHVAKRVANISMRDLVSTVKLSPAAYKIGNRRDKRRLQQAATSTSENFKTSRKKLRLSKSVTESRKKQQEGSTYQAGGF